MAAEETSTVFTYVADETTAPRMGRAWSRYRLTSPPFLVLGAAVVVFSIAYLLLAHVPLASLPVYIVILVAVFAFAWFRLRSGLRKSFVRHFPAGAEFSVGVGETALVIWGPTARSTINYSSYRDVAVRDSIVILRQRASSIATVLPRELLPGDAAELVRSRVAAAGA